MKDRSARQYEDLKNLLKDCLVIIDNEKRKGHIQSYTYPTRHSNAKSTNVVASEQEIDKAFSENNIPQITKIVETISCVMCVYINKEKALQLIEKALEALPSNAIYETTHKNRYGCFYRHRETITITCGQRLNNIQESLARHSDKKNDIILGKEEVKDGEREEARARFMQI